MAGVDSFVYFISAPAQGLIKIGYSASSPDGRLANLQASSPAPLERLALVAGSRTLEQLLHIRFVAIRSHMEWFRAEPELLAYVEAHAYPWTGPVGAFVKGAGIPPRCHEREIARADPWFRMAVDQCLLRKPGPRVFDPRLAPRCLALLGDFAPTAPAVREVVDSNLRYTRLYAEAALDG